MINQFLKNSIVPFLLFLSVVAFSQEEQKVNQGFEFIAMEYYAGISNRTFVVFVTDSLIWGGKVNGIIMAGLTFGHTTKEIEDPYFYADPERLIHFQNLDPIKFPADIHFLYKRSEIKSITYTPKRKWGMGDVVHTGRLFLHFEKGGKREFILLGKPDISLIKKTLNATEN